MRRLYYVVDDLATCERVARAVRDEGISHWNFHVLSKDREGLYRHRIHAAATYHQLDYVHTGSRWGLAGAALAAVLALAAYSTQPLPWSVDGVAVVLATLVGGLFGAWQGAMRGMYRESYKITPFHDDIEAGRYLVMVDVNDGNRARVRELMNLSFPEVEFRGRDSVTISPFARQAGRHAHRGTGLAAR